MNLDVKDVRNLLQAANEHKALGKSLIIATSLSILQDLIRSFGKSDIFQIIGYAVIIGSFGYHLNAIGCYRRALDHLPYKSDSETKMVNPLLNTLVFFFVPFAPYVCTWGLKRRIQSFLDKLGIDPESSETIPAIQSWIERNENEDVQSECTEPPRSEVSRLLDERQKLDNH